MRILLDTHIALWLTLDQGLLNSGERARLGAQSTEVLFSAVSIWELRLKWHSFHLSGERKGPVNPRHVLETLLDGGMTQLHLTGQHAVAELGAPLPHKDPFDELLLVQAQEEGCKLLTRDASLANHPLAVTA